MTRKRTVEMVDKRLDQEVEDRMDLQSRVTKLEKSDIVFSKKLLVGILIALMVIAGVQLYTVYQLNQLAEHTMDLDAEVDRQDEQVSALMLWSRQFSRDVELSMNRMIRITETLLNSQQNVTGSG